MEVRSVARSANSADALTYCLMKEERLCRIVRHTCNDHGNGNDLSNGSETVKVNERMTDLLIVKIYVCLSKDLVELFD